MGRKANGHFEEPKKFACLCRVIERQLQSRSLCKPLTRAATQSWLALILIHILKMCSVCGLYSTFSMGSSIGFL